MRWRDYSAVTAVLASAVAFADAAPAYAAPEFRTGVTDFSGIQQGTAEDRALSLQRLKQARGSVVRISWPWRSIERSQPPDATIALEPGFSGYDWAKVDAMVRDAAAAGLQPLLKFGEAPAWWEGAGRPAISARAPAGTWRPNGAAYGRFMTAVARRYSGTYPDPLRPGQALPRVRYWQLWNEPNLPNFLTPQWRRSQGRVVPESPRLYRQLLNSGYRGVKSVHGSNLVITAGTAPYGEPWTGGRRMPPARFTRELLCVTGRTKPKARNCRSNPVWFDALAHHPYPIGPPGRKAINPDDVAPPDWAKLKRPLAVAIKAGNVRPRKTKQLWATEISWDSHPDPRGLSLAKHGEYVAGAMYVLWRQGVRAMVWWNLRDEAKGAGFQYTLQSGLFRRGATLPEDRPKPALRAFRFPFTAYRSYTNFRGRGSARAWGIAPSPGVVRIERRTGGKWRVLKTVSAGRNHVFDTRLNVGTGTRLRAAQNGETSLTWRVF